MTLEELDQKLNKLKGELTQITANVVELQGWPICKAAKTWTMTGQTKDKVMPAFAALDRIWEYVPLIKGVLDKADAAKAEMPTFGKGGKITEINNLLDGQSITMPRVVVPLEQRDLLQAAETKPTQSIEQLKAAMVDAFGKAKAVFIDLRDCRRKINEQYDKIAGTIGEIKEEFESYGKGNAAEVTDLTARLATIDKRRDSDPLSMNTMDGMRVALDPYILIARTKLGELGRERDQIAVNVERAAGKLQDLKTYRIRALEFHQVATSGIENPQGLIAPPSIKELSQWLDDLKKFVAEKKWEPARTGLIDWTQRHDEVSNEIQAALAANERIVHKRQAILDRWTEAKRKCEEFKGKGLVPDRALLKFGEQAEEFTTGKMDLAKADTAVFSYETKLGELISRLGH